MTNDVADADTNMALRPQEAVISVAPYLQGAVRSQVAGIDVDPGMLHERIGQQGALQPQGHLPLLLPEVRGSEHDASPFADLGEKAHASGEAVAV